MGSGPDNKRRFISRAFGALAIAGSLTVAACGTNQDRGVSFRPIDCTSGGPRRSEQTIVLPLGQNLDVSDKTFNSGASAGDMVMIGGTSTPQRPTAYRDGKVVFDSSDGRAVYQVSGSPSASNGSPATAIKIESVCK